MKGDMLIMDQTQWNSQMSDLVGNMINLLNEQQKKIDTMQDVITKMGKGLTEYFVDKVSSRMPYFYA
jgi:hypothetical protein